MDGDDGAEAVTDDGLGDALRRLTAEVDDLARLVRRIGIVVPVALVVLVVASVALIK
jgi:hypothetical protein